MDNAIDIVILWVDGSDESWTKSCAKYSKKSLDRIRFEDSGTLKYVFRTIDQYMPWARNIYLVTPGHYPSWLNVDNPKVKMVNQNDLFTNNDDLPVFNSCSVEVNLHRIEGLSEQFIYFNDDMVVLKMLDKEYFFKNRKVNDFFIITRLFHEPMFSHQMLSQMICINSEIKKDKSLKKQIFRTINFKYGIINILRSLIALFLNNGEIPLFSLNHHPQAYLKSSFVEFERSYPEVIGKTSSSRFRSEYQVSQTIFRFWSLIKGNFNPVYHNDSVYVGVDDLNKLKKDLNTIGDRKNISMICLNEHSNFDPDNYPEYKQIISKFLSKRLPDASSFEN